jgi:hypothetical protein
MIVSQEVYCNYKPVDGELLPREVYNQVLKVVEEEY